MTALRIASLEQPDDPGGGAHANELCASAGYFAALGIDLVAGRTFNAFDRPGSSKVAIVSVDYAGRPSDWAPRHPRPPRQRREHDAGLSWAEVVGVVRDVRMAGPESRFSSAGSMRPSPEAPTLTARCTSSSEARRTRAPLIPAIRAAAARLDGNLPLSSVRTFDEVPRRLPGLSGGSRWC